MAAASNRTIPPAPSASLRGERGGARAARWLAGVALAWGALAFGAVYPWAYWPLAGACAAAGGIGFCTDRQRLELPPGVRRLAVALVVVAAAALLQLVPVPLDLLRSVNPKRLELLEGLHVPLALGLVRNHALSLDPNATIRALFLYGAFALLTVGLARSLSRTGALSLARTVTLVGAVLAVTGIIQKALYAGAIYGFWKPLTAGANPFGPFVNKNHFAGWMLMAIPLALGYLGATLSRARGARGPTIRHRVVWFSSRDANAALQAAGAVLVMGLALAMTLSRSGMLSLALALALGVCAALRRQDGTLARSVTVGALALAAVGVVAWAGTATLVARFAAVDAVELGGRLPIWDRSLQILRDFWIAGSGLNTYGAATLLYPGVVAGQHLREAHNDYIQLAVEGGVLLCVPILAVATTFIAAVRRQLVSTTDWTYWIRLGAVTGILAISVQSIVEFSLQMPGNAALFAILCAVALHLRLSPHSSTERSPSSATPPLVSVSSSVRPRS